MSKELEAALQEGVWAIAATPAGKYIGQLHGLDHVEATNDKDYFLTHLTNPMKMCWPLEFSSTLIPRPTRGGTIGFERIIQATCISRCFQIDRMVITITPTDLFFFQDMAKEDAEWHRDLIRDGVKSAQANRLSEAGLIHPNAPHRQDGRD